MKYTGTFFYWNNIIIWIVTFFTFVFYDFTNLVSNSSDLFIMVKNKMEIKLKNWPLRCNWLLEKHSTVIYPVIYEYTSTMDNCHKQGFSVPIDVYFLKMRILIARCKHVKSNVNIDNLKLCVTDDCHHYTCSYFILYM